MRKKFAMPQIEYSIFTVIIIVEVNGRMVGMIVDAVSDVLSIPVADVQSTPHFTAKIEIDFIEGIGQKDDDLIIILDTDHILKSEEFDILDNDDLINKDLTNDKK